MSQFFGFICLIAKINTKYRQLFQMSIDMDPNQPIKFCNICQGSTDPDYQVGY
jgi:hypothetical protein